MDRTTLIGVLHTDLPLTMRLTCCGGMAASMILNVQNPPFVPPTPLVLDVEFDSIDSARDYGGPIFNSS